MTSYLSAIKCDLNDIDEIYIHICGMCALNIERELKRKYYLVLDYYFQVRIPTHGKDHGTLPCLSVKKT